MNQEQKINTTIVVLLVFLLIATLLLFFRFIIGKNVLSQHEKNVEIIQKSISGEEGSKLDSPVFTTSAPTRGSQTAENIIYEFASFTCPYCLQQSEVFNQLFDAYPNKVFLIWKDVVNPLDFTAYNAALAARCAQAQGNFWQYHDFLFANQDNLSEDVFISIANTLGLDVEKFSQCYNNKEQGLFIESDLQEASLLDIDGTPYLFINNQPVSGVLTLEELEQILNLR